jgi:DNA-binding NtrC family response regulator
MQRTVIIVEDEFFICLAASAHLRAAGYNALEVPSGDTARKLIEGGQTLDILFSDINMSGEMDGLALAAWVRRERPTVKIVLTTGAIGLTRAKALTEYDGFFEKPYILEQVEALFARLMKSGPLSFT